MGADGAEVRLAGRYANTREGRSNAGDMIRRVSAVLRGTTVDIAYVSVELIRT